MSLSDRDIDYVWVSNFYGVEIDPEGDFQRSQRADHIVRAVSSRVRFNRAIINPKWDAYYSHEGAHRLHILFGEANKSEYATMLKVGATAAVLDIIERGEAPEDLILEEPLRDLRSVSRDSTYRWLVTLLDGSTIGAVDLQRRYLATAQRCLSGQDAETDWVLSEWERTLDDLERDPMSTSDRLDWSAKRSLYEGFIASEGLSWQDDMLHSLDLEYHNINPAVGLHAALEDQGRMIRYSDDVSVARAMTSPPASTRAHARGGIVSALIERPGLGYIVDWDGVFVESRRQINLTNPLRTYAAEAQRFIERLPTPSTAEKGAGAKRRKSRGQDPAE